MEHEIKEERQKIKKKLHENKRILVAKHKS
jgi:hypothetical protein